MTPSKEEKKNCSCCGRYLIHPRHTTMKEQFCKKCGITHLGNVMSISEDYQNGKQAGITRTKEKVLEILDKREDDLKKNKSNSVYTILEELKQAIKEI